MQLAGKRVLVTGASRGIGRSLAIAFAQAGAEVALVARDAAALEALAAELGGTAHPADLLDLTQRHRLVAQVEDEAGLAHGTAALRDELRGLPVAVTTVMVGGVPTDMLATGESYGPFREAFDRLRLIQLVPDTAADDLAAAVVKGVEQGRRTVYLPRRAAPFVGLVEAPRKIVHVALTGVRRHL